MPKSAQQPQAAQVDVADDVAKLATKSAAFACDPPGSAFQTAGGDEETFFAQHHEATQLHDQQQIAVQTHDDKLVDAVSGEEITRPQPAISQASQEYVPPLVQTPDNKFINGATGEEVER